MFQTVKNEMSSSRKNGFRICFIHVMKCSATLKNHSIYWDNNFHWLDWHKFKCSLTIPSAIKDMEKLALLCFKGGSADISLNQAIWRYLNEITNAYTIWHILLLGIYPKIYLQTYVSVCMYLLWHCNGKKVKTERK